jgi:2-amino-4-hydroxy-6-hydroxymethyldihydropteridine diphosphokinase
MSPIAYLGIGSNLGDRVGYIQQAVQLLQDLATLKHLRILSTSSFYETEPVGFQDQEWFVNAALAIETDLTPQELLTICQDVETRLGRVRDPNNQFGPRTLDIDLLFYDALEINAPGITVPHPRVHQRAYALVPLLEINPRLIHPVLGKTVEQLHQDLDDPEEVFLYGTRSQFETLFTNGDNPYADTTEAEDS